MLGPLAVAAERQTRATFRVEETTIAAVHASMKSGALTCTALVSEYLRRIEAYDKNGSALNAIVQVNPDAMKQAADLDGRFKTVRIHRPPALHPRHCQRQLRDDRLAERCGLTRAEGIRVAPRRLPGPPHQGGGCNRPRQVEHGGMGVHAL